MAGNFYRERLFVVTTKDPPLDEAPTALHVVPMIKKKCVYVCINKKGGQACIGPRSRAVFRALHQRARERAKEGGVEVEVERMQCMGYCGEGPNAKIHGGDVFNEVSLDDVEKILDAAEGET